MLDIRHVEDVVGDFLESQLVGVQILLKNQTYLEDTKLVYPRLVYGVAITSATPRQSTPMIYDEVPGDDTKISVTIDGDVLLQVSIDVYGDPDQGVAYAKAIEAYNNMLGPFKDYILVEEFKMQSLTAPVDISVYVETKVEERWRFTASLHAASKFQYTIDKVAEIKATLNTNSSEDNPIET